MTAVFVHGVPETPAVWHGLLAALDRPDTVTLSLPGFDTARPAGFGATMDEYAAWLAAQLERLGDPVPADGGDHVQLGRSGAGDLLAGDRPPGHADADPARREEGSWMAITMAIARHAVIRL